MHRPPAYDKSGYNVFDPNDSIGLKSRYITLLQEKALARYLPRPTSGLAVDVGCGYGRLSGALAKLGWKVMGVDPDRGLLEYAQQHHPDASFCQAALPNLPVQSNSASLLMLHNVLRPLLMMGKLDCLKGIAQYVAPSGHLLVVDNIRKSHPDYLDEDTLINLIEREGFRLERRVTIRAARWWMIYLIRYGLIPERWLDLIAEYELNKRQRSQKSYKWQYTNVFFLFRKTPDSSV